MSGGALQQSDLQEFPPRRISLAGFLHMSLLAAFMLSPEGPRAVADRRPQAGASVAVGRRESTPVPQEADATVRQPADPGTQPTMDADQRPIPVEKTGAVRVLPLVLLVCLFLSLLVLVGSYVLVRMARRYRSATEHRANAPTPSHDVWAMHELPDDLPADDSGFNHDRL